MNILYLCSQYLPTTNAVAIRTAAHVDALLSAGHRVHLITGPESAGFKPTNMNLSLSCVRKLPPSNTQKLLSRTMHELLYGFALALKIIRQPRPNLLVITSPPFFMTLICAFAGRLRGIPLLLDVRDRYPTVLFTLGYLKPDSLSGIILRWLERNLYRKAKKVVTVTPHLAAAITSQTGVQPDVVLNGYPQALELDASAVEERCLNFHPFRIVMHGNFGNFFDSDTFIRLVRLLETSGDPVELVLVGSGRKLKRLQDLNSPLLTILPPMDQAGIATLLWKCHLGLSIHSTNTSMLQAFPVKVFEFIGAGIPALVIPINAAGQQINQLGLGLACQSDQLALATNYIHNLCINTRAYRETCSHVLEQRSVFSRHKQAFRLIEIIKKLF